MVVNPGKKETIEAEGKEYRRLCIKTHVITDADKMTDVVMQYAPPKCSRAIFCSLPKRRWPAPRSGLSP